MLLRAPCAAPALAAGAAAGSGREARLGAAHTGARVGRGGSAGVSLRRRCRGEQSVARAQSDSGLIWPGSAGDGVILPPFPRAMIEASSSSPAAQNAQSSYSEHKPKTPPPDLPSLLLDSRIVYLGMPLVPAVTELIVAELLYLQYTDGKKPIYLYINSTGCTRADGETVGFETEATAIYDTMNYVGAPVYTVGIGVALGQACMLLAAGQKGNRYMMPHATAMLHQPRTPPTGQRQAIELYIKWREVLEQKQLALDILHKATGHSHEKLDKDMQRPLYMQPADALEYNVIDKIMTPTDKTKKNGMSIKISDDVKGGDAWDKDAGLVKQAVPRSG